MTRYRIVQEAVGIYVQYKGWIFWHTVSSGFGNDKGWRFFESEQDAADFIYEQIDQEHRRKPRRVLYDTKSFPPLDKSGVAWKHDEKA